MEEIIELHEKLRALAENRKVSDIRDIFDMVPAIDIAEALDKIEEIHIILYILRNVKTENTAEVFTELTVEKQEQIISAFNDKELINLLENSFADDIVDTLEELPANIVTRVLKVADKDLRNDINRLLNYKENTAGSVMTTEYFEIKNTLTVKEAMSAVRARGKEAETVYTIFVRDDKRNMVGTIDLDDLIFAEEDTKVTEIMNEDFVTCHVNDDQEEVALGFKRYDLNAMAVLNSNDKIVGIITIDDVVDIIVEEATEDIARLNNVSNMEDPYLKTPVWKLVLKCAPWIIALMILQVFSTMILSSFQNAIANLVILSVFTPLIMDAGGNSGGQTTTIIVRSLALGEFSRGDTKKVLWKEFRVALFIAGVIALFAFGWLMFEMYVGIVNIDAATLAGKDPNIFKTTIAGLVATTLFITMVASRMVGCLLPFLAKALKRDPAVMCGPLTTTIVDIVSLLTYFLLWTFVFAKILGM